MARTITLNASLTWPDVKEDYTLRYDGHVIGRIRLDQGVWDWQIVVPMAVPAWARGTANSLDESKSAFAAAWGRFLNETNPQRLERAWELDCAAEARRQRLEMARKDKA